MCLTIYGSVIKNTHVRGAPVAPWVERSTFKAECLSQQPGFESDPRPFAACVLHPPVSLPDFPPSVAMSKAGKRPKNYL